VIDQAAAVIILQSALDAERAKGERAGELVEAETVHDTHE
jgi:putative Holliday junction resolvase